MSDRQPDEAADAAFLEQITPTLRAPVTLDDAFDARVMNDVRAEARLRAAYASRGWWRTPRAVAMSPLATLAMAAGFAAVVALGTLAALSRGAVFSLAGASAADTVHVVRFVFIDREASRVSMVGDFNGWNADATPLVRTGVEGVWSVTLPMPRGRHEYAFIADGTRWSADPLAQAHADDFGTESSIVTVGQVSQ